MRQQCQSRVTPLRCGNGVVRALAVSAGWRSWLGLGVLALAGCVTSTPVSEPPPACPAALILEGAERTSVYRAGAQPRASEIRYIAVLRDLTSACRYYSDADGGGVDVDLTFNLIAERGPAMAGSEPVTYFVATLGPATADGEFQ